MEFSGFEPGDDVTKLSGSDTICKERFKKTCDVTMHPRIRTALSGANLIASNMKKDDENRTVREEGL